MKGLAVQPSGGTRQLVEEGLQLQRANRPIEAGERYERALQLDPGCFDALQLLGVLRFRSGDGAVGVSLLQRALALHPDHAPTLNNLGNALRSAGHLAEALAAYQRALRLFPDPPPPVVLRNIGSVLLDLGDAAQAGPALRTAVARAPDDAIAWCWLGHHARAEQRAGEAVEFYESALRLQPKLSEAQRGLGSAYRDLHRYREAAEAFGRTLALQPGYLLAQIGKADAQLALADWSGFAGAVRTIEQSPTQPGHMINPMKPALFTDDPLVLRRYAEAYAALHTKLSARPAAEPARTHLSRASSDSRTRIGYLSADLREHPVGQLLAGVVECHDRSAFDVQLFALDRGDTSDVRRRLTAVVEPTPVGSLSDIDLAARLREAKLDVLVDLMGYTDQHRARVLAMRVAPVQVCWLGYPGTLGADLADYLIADGYTVGAGEEGLYAERVVRLPDCLLPGDRSRIVSEPLERAAYGLPDKAVVLCSFNQTRKLNPLVFDIWLHALRELPDAVLWLYEERSEASDNLRRAARERGVDPARLVFAPRLPGLADHLARYRTADLALDTFPYGSHSTALDALWAGCPLIAWIGRSFPARVSGSVLTAAGLPELVASSAQDYHALILALARDADRRSDLRARLIANRDHCALFDARRFTHALERAFLEITRRSRLGQAPEHLWIP